MDGQSLPIVKLDASGHPVHPRKPPVDPATLVHREFLDGPFWQRIPAYKSVDEATFLDHRWQAKKSITQPKKLIEAVQDLVSEEFLADARAGFARAPMSVRVSPYLLSLVDWQNPYDDPIRRQFLPVRSHMLADHPKLDLDSLHEQADAPTEGLTHRYPDKVLFLALDTCPVYCRFCTRSYAVGINTEEVEKVSLKANRMRWDQAFAYIESRPEIEDVVISGGDVYQLRAEHLTDIGHRLLDIKHVRRMRFATKGPAVMPQKLLTDDAWVRALVEVVERGRRMCKEVVVHTHFTHPNEITAISKRAMDRLFQFGVIVRNQSVLQRGVNDSVAVMKHFIKKLSYMNVQPYYVYMHDLVKGAEDMRTTLAVALDLEKQIRGVTAGFNTPTFVVDAPGGGGKRDVHSFEHYNRETGVSVYRSPNVDPDAFYLYFDPIDQLPESGRARWADKAQHDGILEEAIAAARDGQR
ncbi:MAG: KamA family radical SAM protein [Myxococcales bacterium]|nr:KamA family radical SAM protein [Myxococcales bacterium]